MKAFVFVTLALVLSACGKEKRSVQYSVYCGNCSIGYIDDQEVQHYVKLAPDTIFTPYALDTIIGGVDTIVTAFNLNITPGPFAWSHRMEVDPEARIYFGVSRLEVQGITTVATRVIDGLEETKTTGPERTFLEFH